MTAQPPVDEPTPTWVDPVVAPTRDDSFVAGASSAIGGPFGDRAVRDPRRFWVPLRVVMALVAFACLLGWVQKQPCEVSTFSGDIWVRLCYTDIGPLYGGEGFAEGNVPYFNTSDSFASELDPDGTQNYLEYPVLTGALVTAANAVTDVLVPADDSGAVDTAKRTRTFFDVNVLLLSGLALAGAYLVATTHRRRPWDAAMLAVGIPLTAFINWDFLAVALAAGGLWAWSRRRPWLAGVLIGLGAAAKFYPFLFLGPLLVLCLRAGKTREWLQALGAAVAAWLVVNLPVMVGAWDGWKEFYVFSKDRGASYGSIWFALGDLGHPLSNSTINTLGVIVFGSACIGIAWLALAAPTRPRLPQLLWLVLVAFLLTNKVYSPQYVLWLLFLFPLVRPRWRDFLVWFLVQALYFVAVWWYIEGLVNPDLHVPKEPHTVATFGHYAVSLWICALVVRDILRPAHDPVRSDGDDDPAGGVLDEAPDVFVVRGSEPFDDVERRGREADVAG